MFVLTRHFIRSIDDGSLANSATRQWPTWRKDVILVITGLSAGVVGAYGPMLSPGFNVVSASMGISVETLSQSTAWLILTIGLSLFVFNPIAKKMGRRPVYVACSVIMLAVCIWSALSTSYTSFLWSRIIGGLGMAPYEVLVQCTIADMYFVHQRATRIAIWNMFLLCGISGGSLISGYIIEVSRAEASRQLLTMLMHPQNQSWQWTFIWCAIFFGALLPLVILFVPETAYNRPSLPLQFAGADHNRHLASDVKGTSGEHSSAEAEKTPETARHEETAPAKLEADETAEPAVEPKKTYLQSLRIFSGTYSTTPFLKIFLRPFVIFWYPAVFWSFMMYGATLTWIVVFSVVNAVIFNAPPYNFSVSQTGLISISPFVFTIIGELVSGPLNDWLCVKLAKKNHGIYEPEFRLPLVIIPLILGVVGFFGFGATVHFQTHWIGPVLCFGFANMSLAFLNACVFGYVIDAHSDLSEEGKAILYLRVRQDSG